MKEGKEIHSLEEHTEKVSSISFSPDGNFIVSGSDDKTIKIWDRERGTLVRNLKGHNDQVTSVSFSSDGNNIVSSSWD